MQTKKRVLYLEGRPHAHVMHRKFALSVCEDVLHIDERIRWQDVKMSPLKRILAWIRNAEYLSVVADGYDAILVDNLHFTPVLLNVLFRRGRKKIPIIVHLGSHTLYFMWSKRFGPLNNWLHKKALASYSAVICEGNMAWEFLEDILPSGKRPKSYVTFLGPSSDRHDRLVKVSPNLQGNNILLIANGPGEFRMYYKGLDLMINAFRIVLETNPSLSFVIVGSWEPEVVQIVMSSFPDDKRENVFFAGSDAAIDTYIEQAALCVHCSRGDAFPTSTIEAMTAGLPTLVSDVTGTKEIVAKIDQSFIAKLEEKDIANKILKYFESSVHSRQQYSKLFQKEAKQYNEEAAVEHYQNTFGKILIDLEDT